MDADLKAGLRRLASLAAQVQGPGTATPSQPCSRAWHCGRRRAQAAAQAALPALAEGEAVVTRAGEWIGPGWARVLRSGEAQHGSLLREREINATCARRSRRLRRIARHACSKRLSRLRASAPPPGKPEQQREDAQPRAVPGAPQCGVAEASPASYGRASRDGWNRRAVRAFDRDIEAELAQALGGAFEALQQAHSRRQRSALAPVRDSGQQRMGEHETMRQRARIRANATRAWAQARGLRRATPRAERCAKPRHRTTLALTLESQRASACWRALSQALERMGSQRAQLDSRLGELHRAAGRR